MADPSLFQDFIPEAVEALEEMEAGLLQLEAQPGNKQVINTIFRSAHTIKGSAEYLGLSNLSSLAHKLESLLETFRHGDKVPDGPTLDVLMASKDRMVRLVGDLDASQQEKTPVDDLVAKLEELAVIPDPQASKPKKAEPVKKAKKPAAKKSAEEEAALSPLDDLGELDSLLDDDLVTEPAAAVTAAPVSSAGAAGASDSPLVKDALAEMDAFATLEEEYDKELFSIFEEHLKEQLGLLAESVKLLVQGGGDFAKTGEIVEALKSSAGYMDYQRLVSLYDEWKRVLESYGLSLPAGDPGLVEVIGIQARTLLSHTARAPKEAAVEEASEAAEGEDLASLIGQAAAPEPPAPKEKQAPAAPAAPAPIKAAPAAPPVSEPLFSDSVFDTVLATPAPTDENKGLFDELDSVFDPLATQAPAGVAVSDPFADDFEESLSRGAVVPPRTPAPSKSTSAVLPDRPQPGPEAASPMGAPPAPRVEKAPEPPKVQAAEPMPKEEKAPSAPEPEAVKEAPEEAEQPKAAAEKPAPEPPKVFAEEAPKPVREPVGFGQDDLITERLAKQSLRVDAAKVDNLMNQVGELVVSRAAYGQLYYDMRQFQQRLHEMRIDPKELKWVRELTFRLSEATVALGRVANDLQEGVMKVRMLPISQLFNRYPRLVRDLAHDTGKKVNLEVKGEDTELDKMVIEEIANPLVHIIRNAVDHGIEPVAERLRTGKPETAVVKLESYHESNHVVVEITDDGRGINLDKIRETALMKGFATREELDRMAPRELVSFIMKPGFTTAAAVTKTSGRGVGMDVVKKNIEKLNGTVEIDSKLGQGTRVRIKIPLTLAIIQALLVRVGNEIFTLPLSVVEETLSASFSEIATIEGMEVIQMRDKVLPLLRLTDIFHLTSKNTDGGKVYVVVVNTGMRDVGLVVDSLIGQEEVVIKPLVDYLQENCGFSGATILGDGRISLILDVYQMVNLSVARVASARGLFQPTLEGKFLPGSTANDAAAPETTVQ